MSTGMYDIIGFYSRFCFVRFANEGKIIFEATQLIYEKRKSWCVVSRSQLRFRPVD